MNVEVIGVRHFSPACARWVAQRIRAVRPAWVLIEGPSDFNERIGELALPHRLPIALYSYAVDAQSTRHCYSPFIEFAPEWAALESARDVGAEIRFIDLPFYAPAWHEHTLRYDVSAHRGRDRYARTMRAVAAQVGLDGDDAVWDHLFEQTGDASDLGERLSFWFENLRGDEAGEHEDVEREQFMARYVAWAAAQGGSVIVVCGGWQMGRAALAAQRKLAAGDGDAAFYRAKVATARFFADQDLSRARGLAEATMHAGASTMALAEEQF